METKALTFEQLPYAVHRLHDEIQELKNLIKDQRSKKVNTLGEDEFLTPEETAQILKVSKVTIWDWAKRGILKKHTIGNKVRYLRSEVMAAPVSTKKGGIRL